MNIKALKTKADYEEALLRIEALMDAAHGTPEGDELDVLVTLTEAYEREHFPIDNPDPVEAILFRMEQLGLERSDLVPLLGSRGRVSEVLNRKRGLSLAQIRRLNSELRIPLQNLIGG